MTSKQTRVVISGPSPQSPVPGDSVKINYPKKIAFATTLSKSYLHWRDMYPTMKQNQTKSCAFM